jgi:hypothetical protein
MSRNAELVLIVYAVCRGTVTSQGNNIMKIDQMQVTKLMVWTVHATDLLSATALPPTVLGNPHWLFTRAHFLNAQGVNSLVCVTQ